jgi:hypothetical protein
VPVPIVISPRSTEKFSPVCQIRNLSSKPLHFEVKRRIEESLQPRFCTEPVSPPVPVMGLFCKLSLRDIYKERRCWGLCV